MIVRRVIAFAFVVFGVAQTAGVLSVEAAGQLTIAVALSMAATPLMLLLHDKLAAWRAAASERADDEIKESGNPVIIAGFGRFGQIVARLLFANGMRAIVLDHDAEQVDLLRKFGYKVFYGDATRLDLLRSAGAGEACLLVNAIDDIADSLALTDRVREHFPDLPMIARARNVTHYIELRTRGVTVVERETFESALRTGRHVLERWASIVSRTGDGGRVPPPQHRDHDRAGPHFSDEQDALRGEGGTRRVARVLHSRPRPVRDGAAQRLEGRILNTRSNEWQRTRPTSCGRAAIRISCRTGTAGDM
jgi:glutathione-regulated potassium-efflux system ancillary protein KefC